jgi:hypothetical protein
MLLHIRGRGQQTGDSGMSQVAAHVEGQEHGEVAVTGIEACHVINCEEGSFPVHQLPISAIRADR